MAALLVGVWVNPLTGGDAHAATISILDIGDSGTTADGTTFVADPNPSQPSSGTGVFQPFVRIQATGSRGGGLQNGFNTDAKEPAINFNTKGGTWTRSVQFGELTTINGNYVEGGTGNLQMSITSSSNSFLNITGNCAFGGSLTVLGPSGVTGGWNLIHFGSYTGSFSSISLPPENPPMHWNVAYNVPQDYFRIWTSAY